MTDLKRGKSYITLVGKAKINENSFSGVKVSESGYTYVRINIGVETSEGNVVYLELMGGYQPSKPLVYATSKEDNTPLEINWGDRLNEKILDSVADYRIHNVSLERDSDNKTIKKRFLSPMDMHDYLKDNLVDGMEVVVRGSMNFSEYQGETKRRYQIQNIYLPYQEKEKDDNGKETGNVLPTNYKAEFTQTILLDEDSFKKLTKKDKEDGEVVIPALAVDYVSKKNGKKINKFLPFPLAITVPINPEKPDVSEKILNALFKVKKGQVRELTIEGNIIEGYDQQSIKDEDIELASDIKELIEMGLYSVEEAKSKMTVRGNKVSKLVFSRPFLQKKDEGLVIDKDDDKYKPSDLVVLEGVEEDSIPSDIEDDSNNGQDGSDDWMKALGI